MKVRFPNPDDFVNDIKGFFDQLELCVYHARKASEKILEKYSEEDFKKGENTPFVAFSFAPEDKELRNKLEEIDPNYELPRSIDLEIVEV